MSDEERAALLAALERSTKAAEMMTREEARAYLVRLGTHDADGNLTPQYGGKLRP